MKDLLLERRKLWLLAQSALLDEIGPENWDASERKMADYFHDCLYRTSWRPSEAKRLRDKLLRAFNEATASPKPKVEDEEIPY